MIILKKSNPTDGPAAYITLAEIEEFSLCVADVSRLAAASNDLKLRAARQASDQIDMQRYAGKKASADQARAFPRFKTGDPETWKNGKPSHKNIGIPNAVKRACFYQMLSIIADPQRLARQEARHDGIVSQANAGMSENYRLGPAEILCMEAQRLLQPYKLKTGYIV